MENGTKKPAVLVYNQETKTSEERPLEEVKKEAKKTKTIPLGIFTMGAFIQLIQATGQ